MPVYHFTYHAHGTWLPDHPKGFTQEERGYQPPNKPLAKAYRDAMKFPAVQFNHSMQRRLIEKLQAVVKSENYRLHGVATDLTHVHTVVSWRDEALRFTQVRGRIKNLLSLDLSRAAGTTGRPWFTSKSSRKRVSEPEHLDYLLHVYLPKHRGWQWYEARGWVKPKVN